MTRRETPSLSPLENSVMNLVWKLEQVTADAVRLAMSGKQPMKDSTARTILRRLEDKGYVKHRTEGRTYIYSPRIESRSAASRAVRGIIEKFCQGSVEDLLVGMVDDELVSPQKLRELAERVSRAEAAKNRGNSKKG